MRKGPDAGQAHVSNLPCFGACFAMLVSNDTGCLLHALLTLRGLGNASALAWVHIFHCDGLIYSYTITVFLCQTCAYPGTSVVPVAVSPTVCATHTSTWTRVQNSANGTCETTTARRSVIPFRAMCFTKSTSARHTGAHGTQRRCKFTPPTPLVNHLLGNGAGWCCLP